MKVGLVEQQTGIEKYWYDVEIAHMARFAIYASSEDHAKLLADYWCFERELYGPPLGRPPAAFLTSKPFDPSEEQNLETMRNARGENFGHAQTSIILRSLKN